MYGIKKSKVFVISLFLIVAGMMFMMTSPASVQAQETFNLTYSGFFAPHDQNEVIAIWYCEELQKRTNDRVKIKMYFSEQLGKIFDGPKMLRAGVADIAQFTNATPEFAVLGLTEAPYVVPNPSSVTTSVKAFWTLYDNGLLKELDDFQPLWWQVMEPRNMIFAKKKVTKLEELKGMKMRGLPGMQCALLDAFGSTSVALPSSEVYTALDRGTIEGLITVPAFGIGGKLFEISKYWLWEDLADGGNIMSMTKKLYNSFPSDIQKIIQQLNGEAQARYAERVKTKMVENKAELQKRGYEVYYLSPEEHEKWKQVAKQVTDKAVADLEARGYPARRAVDALKNIKE
ncbi:MAG: TRAP transporter substrate-binding protein DctP [Deltaproteobacteria bacterium]|nr:TRAP transporter substrate-binding protein DctP [Deltaproteobacteria bacterium]